MPLPLYQVILAYPPFIDWGEQRTMNIPVWRATDHDSCLLVIHTGLDNLHIAYKTLLSWGFAYHKASVRKDDLVLVGVIGSPQLPPTVGALHSKRGLAVLGSPKLLINPTNSLDRDTVSGWDIWSPYGWHGIDLFAYPVRKTYVAVEDTILDAAQDIRRAYQQGSGWRWRIGDAINRLQDSQGLSATDAIAWAREATGNQLALDTLALFARTAAKVPPSQRSSFTPFTKFINKKVG